MLCNCCVRELLILARTWFAFGLPSKPGVTIREEPEAEHHLRVEKARGSLRSYSTEVLGPRVGFPLRRGTNED